MRPLTVTFALAATAATLAAADPGLDDAAIAAVRGMAVALSHPAASTDLVVGLRELGDAQPRYALRIGAAPEATWYRSGGLGAYPSFSTSRLPDRATGFVGQVVRGRLAPAVGAYVLHADAVDLPSGRYAPVTQTTNWATMDLRFTSASLQGVYVEEIEGYRTIGGAVVGRRTFPIELPNFQMDSVSVTARVPMGSSIDEAPTIDPRQPAVALKSYRDAMDRIATADPGAAVVWTTLPLAAGRNTQRLAYNRAIRAWATAGGHPILDIAAVQALGPDGVVATDAEGEILASAWRDGARPTAMNADGRRRLAEEWWTTMAAVATKRRAAMATPSGS
jgi:hypothetical protein